MFSLLKVKVSGYKMLEDNFTIDFNTKSRVMNPDLDGEIYRIHDKLYSHSIIAFTGSNSSGKTTVLDLLNLCYFFIKKGRWPYIEIPLSKDSFDLYLEFMFNDKIYIYEGKISNKLDIKDNENYSRFCNIIAETLKIGCFSKKLTKKYINELKFEEIKVESNNVRDTSILASIEGIDFYRDYISSYNTEVFRKYFYDNFNVFNDELLCSIIRLLDESIEYIKYNEDKSISFKRINDKEVIISRYELLNILSNGTKKGIDLYVRAIKTLKYGGILIIDEIENSFHKNLVNNILFLFKDKNININNAKIIFSTHYVEILDVLNRRDNIFILHKDNSMINVKNMYSDYDVRTELLKSNQFNNNTFNTLLNYENLMALKRKIKHEILNND